MSEQEMVEALARRLCDEFNAEADRTRETWKDNPNDHLSLWRAAARECLRQMRWARKEQRAWDEIHINQPPCGCCGEKIGPALHPNPTLAP